MSATPRPWSTDLEYIVGSVPEGRPGGEVIAHAFPTVANLRRVVPNRENAALIVRAVNAHDELVQAARDVVVWHDLCVPPNYCPVCARSRTVLARLDSASPAAPSDPVEGTDGSHLSNRDRANA